jgi:hypothetical protein
MGDEAGLGAAGAPDFTAGVLEASASGAAAAGAAASART